MDNADPRLAKVDRGATSVDVKAALGATSVDECRPPPPASDHLWYFEGQAYDLREFDHPGGRFAITCARDNPDGTYMVYTYHDDIDRVRKALGPYHVPEAKCPVPKVVFSFEENGFFRTVKKRALKQIGDIDPRDCACTEAAVYVATLFAYAFVTSLVWWTDGSCITHGAALVLGVIRGLIVLRESHSLGHFAGLRFKKHLCGSENLQRGVSVIYSALIGVSNLQRWAARHNIAHHIHVGIDGEDADDWYPLIRESDKRPRKCWHRVQLCYTIPMYMFAFPLDPFRGFIKMVEALITGGVHRESGNGDGNQGVRLRHTSARDYVEMSCVVVLQYAGWLAPCLFHGWTTAATLVICTAFAQSTYVSLIFLATHSVEETVKHRYGSARETKDVDIDFGEHHTKNSANYNTDSWWMLHFSGGLNLQIEHHLFPGWHYSNLYLIRDVVRQTCTEFDIKYIEVATPFHLMRDHIALLWRMGSPTHPHED